jgi:hypothetical protein
MSKLKAGQKFSFKKIQSGGVYYRENHGLGPYAVPSNYYQELLGSGEFIKRMGFTGAEIFEVVGAHDASKGWHVVGKMLGSDIRVSFFQKINEDGDHFVEVKLH